jgi:uncharacterized repeat protein (TIGR01451 family)
MKKILITSYVIFLSIQLLSQVPLQLELVKATTQSTGRIRPEAIGHDDAGNIYTTGSFSDTVDIDPGVGVYELISKSTWEDIYVAKYSAVGDFIWAFSIGSYINDGASDILVDGIGNVYVTGFFRDTADFDPSSNVNNLISSSSWDLYLAKYSSDGSLIWVNRLGGSGNDYPGSLKFDADGNIFMTGVINECDLDPGPGVAMVTGSANMLLAKYAPDGSLIWGKSIGGTSLEESTGIAFAPNGDIVLSGYFQGSVDFDPGPGIAMLTSYAGNSDMVLARYTSTGDYIWAFKIGGNAHDEGRYIEFDSQGNIIMTGTFMGAVDFDPGPETFYMTGISSWEISMVKYSGAGEFIWGKSLLGGGIESIRAIVIDPSDNIYLTGDFADTLDFDPGPGIAELICPDDIYSDIFVAKYTSQGDYIWAFDLGDLGWETSSDLELLPDHSLLIGGQYSQTVDFDPNDGIQEYTVPNNKLGAFFAKYSQSGCADFTLSISSASNITCNVDTGLAVAVAYGGNIPYSYNWNSVIPISNDSLVVSTGGFYTVNASDNEGCLSSRTVFIEEPVSQGHLPFAELINTAMRPGVNAFLFLPVWNEGCTAFIGQVSLQLDSQVTVTNIVPLPSGIVGNTLTWNLPAINYESANFIPMIEIFPDTNLVVGDTLHFTINLMGADTQFVSSYAIPVVNSYDPNDKTPSPAGKGPERCIDQNQRMTYKIRFQNTGTAEAINVLVSDTIPAEYDLNSLRVLQSSHPVITELLPGNVLLFRFDNIHLADSISNEAESHGFIIFQVDQMVDLPFGTVISNSASIYFDYNEPVITNTAFNTICDLSTNISTPQANLGLTSYPNPASNELFVNLPLVSSGVIQLISVTGKVVYNKSVQTTNFHAIPISEISSGFYIVRYESGERAWTSKVIKQ